MPLLRRKPNAVLTLHDLEGFRSKSMKKVIHKTSETYNEFFLTKRILPRLEDVRSTHWLAYFHGSKMSDQIIVIAKLWYLCGISMREEELLNEGFRL